SWTEQAKTNACSISMPYLREERREALVLQHNDMRDAALHWRDVMHEAQLIQCDTMRGTP
ncbi:hypothetical protein HAX54_044491, partial [Datura stramonium]|nr:hypothetical protein [Datura stramonium]